MIEVLAQKIAQSIKRAAPDHPASVDVLRYALSSMLNAVFIIGLSLLISVITGQIINALIVLVSFALLRQVSGGIHLKDGTLCVLVSTAGATTLSFADFNSTVILWLTIAAFLLTLTYAPSRIERQTRIPPKYYPVLKMISLIMVSSNFFIASPVLASTFFVQALTLIRLPMRGGEKA